MLFALIIAHNKATVKGLIMITRFICYFFIDGFSMLHRRNIIKGLEGIVYLKTCYAVNKEEMVELFIKVCYNAFVITIYQVGEL